MSQPEIDPNATPTATGTARSAAAVAHFMTDVVARNPNEPEFHQAVQEVLESVYPVVEANPWYRDARILERLVEPERVVLFRVPWVDDQGVFQINRGLRVEMNSAIGPYKGGLRFHPTVTLGLLKFLAFEQVFKNSLTTLALGGGKGGSDFDPKGKSDHEVMRFCQSFMTELWRHIGPDTDVPAGDIGVGAREIGFLFGQYKRIANRFNGVLTGKGLAWGGSLIRPEATGYGVVYFAEEMLATRGESVRTKTALVSGSGNVAQFAVEKLIEFGARPITMSDSAGTIVDEDGIDQDKLAWIMQLKNVRRGRLAEYVEQFPKARYLKGERPWSVSADLAFPCATQNELTGDDAGSLIANGCTLVCEGANMPTTPDGVDRFQTARLLYGPGKAANAGGVAVSGLEMTQNAGVVHWPREEVDARLRAIMRAIHDNCTRYGQQGDRIDYVRGANIAGFVKVAEAMLAEGCV